MTTVDLIQADAGRIPLGDGCVQCVVTSPPFWGLRDYGTATWEGGDADCDHREATIRTRRNLAEAANKCDGGNRKATNRSDYDALGLPYRDICCKCGARRIDRQLGLEKTPAEYIESMVGVFQEVRRVLRDDGCLFLNMGDSYAGGNCGGGSPVDERKPEYGRPRSLTGSDRVRGRHDGTSKRNTLGPGLKPKDLIGMPWRLALALQADGWYLRSAMPWVKRSCMPESCTDRPTSAVEYVFLLTKRASYFWDADAVRVKLSKPNTAEGIYGDWDKVDDGRTKAAHHRTPPSRKPGYIGPEGGRNFRNTDLYFQSITPPHGLISAGDELVGLDVVSEAFPGAHFATFPRRLVEPLVMAATSDKGCCPECGACWRRVVEKEGGTIGKSWHNHGDDSTKGMGQYDAATQKGGVGNAVNADGKRYRVATVGWKPGCECRPVGRLLDPRTGTDTGETMAGIAPWKPVPCRVFDPFTGSGTVGVVTKSLGRDFVGLELSAEYIAMSRRRIATPQAGVAVKDIPGQMAMFEEVNDE